MVLPKLWLAADPRHHHFDHQGGSLTDAQIRMPQLRLQGHHLRRNGIPRSTQSQRSPSTELSRQGQSIMLTDKDMEGYLVGVTKIDAAGANLHFTPLDRHKLTLREGRDIARWVRQAIIRLNEEDNPSHKLEDTSHPPCHTGGPKPRLGACECGCSPENSSAPQVEYEQEL